MGDLGPFLLAIETDRPRADRWIQDFGEFAEVRLKDGSGPAYLVLDALRNVNRGEYSPQVFADAFRIPLVELGADDDLVGQYGGNTEATPDGTLYMGDSVERGGDGNLFEELRRLGNPDAIELEERSLDAELAAIDALIARSSRVLAGQPGPIAQQEEGRAENEERIDRVTQWRSRLAETSPAPPILAAALAGAALEDLAPFPNQPWLGRLVVALLGPEQLPRVGPRRPTSGSGDGRRTRGWHTGAWWLT